MRTGSIRLAACAAIALCAAPFSTSAQDRRNYESDYAIPLVDRSLTLPQGALQIWAPLGVNLSSGSGGKPTFLNPSISYGVSDRLTVGVRHFLGICFNGTDGGCPEFYNDVSFDALYSLIRAGRLEIAAGAALNLAPITDPFAVSGEVRVPIKFGGGALALVLAPSLNFGLNERDIGNLGDSSFPRKRYAMSFNAGTYDIILPAEDAPNREVVRLPLTVQYQATQQGAFLVGAAVEGPLDPPVGSFSDVYRVPVMFGAIYAPARFLDVGAAFTFPDLLGQDGTADDRFLSLFVALRI